MNTTSVILTLILTCAFGRGGALQAAQHQSPSSPTATYQGAGRYVQVEYPPLTAANELELGVTYNLWIPGGDGFSKKPAMEGAGGGAGEVYAWAIENPDKVSCVYAENPRMHSALAETQPLDNLAPLTKANVPILHVCGSLDPWFKDNTLEVEKRYKKLGGKLQVIVKKGEGHYPLAPEDPAPVVDFIIRAAM
jgi:pimeloyl-ACP methyl ester carboxylesterase